MSFEPYVCMQTNSKCYKKTIKFTPVGILWHSTGANNPNLKRYVQPTNGSANYSKDITKLGKNTAKNDWNHLQTDAGVNAFIGKFADGSIGTVQCLPWEYSPWGCGSGSKGSCNKIQLSDKNYIGWIQFEICEDDCKNKDYATKVYNEAIELTAYLCKKYNIDPNGSVTVKGIKIPTITCHNDANKLGFGTAHADINHWFPKLINKTMSSVRAEVANKINSSVKKYSEEWVNGLWYEKDGSQTYKYKGSWKKNSKGWWFEDTKGWYPQNKWQKIDGNWYYFKEDGYMAHDEWIDGWYVNSDGKYDASKKQSSSYKVKVNANALNVRTGPGTNYKVKTVIKLNETYNVSKVQNEWSYIDSIDGWVMTKYLNKI